MKGKKSKLPVNGQKFPWTGITSFLNNEKRIALSLLFIAIIFNAIFLWSEVAVKTFNLNDEVLHQTSAKQASLALKGGANPSDFWFSQIELGYPLFHYYQHLPQVALATIDQITGKFFPLSRLFDLSLYLFLVFFPLSIFWAALRFGFDYLTSGFSALVASLLSTNGLLGFDYGSYIWRGSGLYPQLWGMFFLPLALAEIYLFINKKGNLFAAVLLSVIVLLSQVFCGYVLVLSSLIFIFLQLNRQEIAKRLKNFLAIFISVGVVVSYFYLSIILDSKYINRSRWEPLWKWDSFGAKKVLSDLFSGQLFDFGRFPSLTILFFISLISLLIFKYYRKEVYRLLLVFTVFWLVLFFGRPTLGFILNNLPFSYFIQLHRFIVGFHLFAIFLIGAGLSLIYQKIVQQKFIIYRLIFWLGLVLIILPAYLGQAKFYQENKTWRIENQTAFSNEKQELSDITQTLKGLPPGKVYAGLPGTFGKFPYYTIGFVPLYAIIPQLGLDSFGYAYFGEALTTDVRLDFNEARPDEYNLFNVRYVLLHKTWTPASFYIKIKEFKNYVLYEVPTTGYFDLISAPAVFYGKSADFYSPNFKWLLSAMPASKQNPILELSSTPQNTFGLPAFTFGKVDDKVISSLSKPQAQKGEILSEKTGLNTYQAQFRADSDCYLMLKVNYDPGWQVYLDSKKVLPVMLSPGFIGIKVAPGLHQVVFSYQPPWFRTPLFILGIFTLLIIFLYSLKNRRKRSAQR